MTLPLANRSRLFFFSQTIDGRPFVNCLPYSLCEVIRWAGYAVPDTYGMTLRLASGVDVAEHVGTGYSDMKKALRAELPAAMAAGVFIFGQVTDDELFGDLPKFRMANTLKDVYSVIARMQDLPRYLRRHVGYTWVGRHAIAIGGRRVCNGVEGGIHTGHSGIFEVWWMDPMGRTTEGYSGEWTPWDGVRPALWRTPSGMIRCIHAQKGTAVPDVV